MRHHRNNLWVLFFTLVGCSTPTGEVSERSRNQALSSEAEARVAPNPVEIGRAPAVETVPVESKPEQVKGPEPKTDEGGKVEEGAEVSANAEPSGSIRVSFSSPKDAAVGALPVLGELVGSSPASERGFNSASEVQSANVEAGVPVMFVRLDHLVRYQKGQNTKSLLLDLQQYLYPLTVGGYVRSSVLVGKRADGDWEALEIGNRKLALSLSAQQKQAEATRVLDRGSPALVQIPTVSASLLSHSESGRHWLTPLYDIPDTGLKAGVSLPADEVLSVLAKIATQIDSSMPN
jgi:hypothetical protein